MEIVNAKDKIAKNKARGYVRRKEVRDYIFNRDKYRCVGCGSSRNLTIDHIIPLAKGGSGDISNLQTLCWDCNQRKADNL